MQTRVSNKTGQCNFSGQRDRRIPSLSRNKRTTGQAQNLAKSRAGPGQPVKIQNGTQDGTVRYFDSLSCHVTQDKTGQSRILRMSKTEKGRSKTEKDVLKQENKVLKQENKVLQQEIWSFV